MLNFFCRGMPGVVAAEKAPACSSYSFGASDRRTVLSSKETARRRPSGENSSRKPALVMVSENTSRRVGKCHKLIRVHPWLKGFLDQGFESRKNNFPTGGVMVMLFVPLAVLILYPLAVQVPVARLLFCCRV